MLLGVPRDDRNKQPADGTKTTMEILSPHKDQAILDYPCYQHISPQESLVFEHSQHRKRPYQRRLQEHRYKDCIKMGYFMCLHLVDCTFIFI